jgi:hypothetical protein
LTTHDEFKTAVEAAKQAYPKWRDTPVTTRQRIMLKFQELIRRDMVTLSIRSVISSQATYIHISYYFNPYEYRMSWQKILLWSKGKHWQMHVVMFFVV